MLKLALRSALIVAAAAGLSQGAQATPETRDRADIADEYRWDLSDIYADWDAWEADLAVAQEKMDAFAALRGTLAEGPEQLLAAMQLQDELMMVVYKAYSYPGLMQTEDTRDNDVQARMQRVQIMMAQFQQASAWVSPEILTIDQATMEQWIDGNAALQTYRFPLMETYRQQQHVLDEGGERILAYASQFNDTPRSEYSMLSTADVKFPEVELTDGSTVKATHATYEYSRQSHREQADREAVFKAHFSIYDDWENTYASIYNGILQRDWFMAQARDYDSTAEAALDTNAIPVSVLENLIETAKAGAEPLRRYHRLRKQYLGLERYRYFDGYLPLSDADWEISYDDSQPMVIESVRLFGPEYQDTVRQAFAERWIDVYETEGKRSGAFSWGVYGVHPYMLLNYAGTLNDAFTVAHEMGHTMHSVRSMRDQPFATHDYTIFVAEVASMTNENLLLDYLLKNTKDPSKRVALLQHAIDDIASGFYRQAMFADFELKAHRAVEEGTPITAEVLQQLYLESLNDFFGDSLDDQDWYRNTWARIPHFYNSPYYVYQYATSKAAASLFHERMTTGPRAKRKQVIAAYLDLLSSGGDDHPITQLQEAGVDFSGTAPIDALVRKMDELVTELERELERE